MKELWQNERSKAGITLALWGVFIFALFIVAIVASKKSDIPQEIDFYEKVIENPLESLVDLHDSFIMEVMPLDGSFKRSYDVTIKDGSLYEGYVEDDSGINRFRCDTKCYKVFLDHEEEYPLYFEELLSNIEDLKNSSFTVSQVITRNSTNQSTEEYKSYIVEQEEKSFQFSLDDNNIVVKIMIETNDKNFSIKTKD